MQDLDKRDAVADKRVEHVTADLAKIKTEKDSLQDQLLQATSQLEQTRCELQTSQGIQTPTPYIVFPSPGPCSGHTALRCTAKPGMIQFLLIIAENESPTMKELSGNWLAHQLRANATPCSTGFNQGLEDYKHIKSR